VNVVHGGRSRRAPLGSGLELVAEETGTRDGGRGVHSIPFYP